MTPPEERGAGRVDWLKVIAGALAAVSSAVLLSTLGAAGTILGAALGSVIVSLTSSFYSSGLAASRRRMSAAQAAAMRRVGTAQAEVRRAARRGPANRAGLEHAEEELDAAKAELEEAAPDQGPTLGERLRLMPWKRVAIFAGGFFLVALIAITAFELIAGKPVSTYTGGTDGGGTSFTRFDHAPRHKSPTKSPSEDDSASPTPHPSKSPGAHPSTSPQASPTEPEQSPSAAGEPTDAASTEPPGASPTPQG